MTTQKRETSSSTYDFSGVVIIEAVIFSMKKKQRQSCLESKNQASFPVWPLTVCCSGLIRHNYDEDRKPQMVDSFTEDVLPALHQNNYDDTASCDSSITLTIASITLY